ncbi:MAG: DUF5312 family protein [Spirochaetales bacterium]|nr:DUF5312 family protein [Spirochaetales bacterium]
MVKSQFDRLVASLSTEERKEMLRKIEETFSLSPEPLAEPESHEPEEEVDPTEYYYQTDILTRIYIFLVSLFTGKEKGEVVLQTFINKLKRKINREYSTYFRLEKLQGLPPFYHLLNNLSNSFNSLREPLFMAMKEKEDFFIFLTNRVLGKKEEEILRETDPYQIEKDNPDYTVNQIHRKIDENYERIMKSLDEDKQRKLIFYSVITRQLHGLAQFDFDRLLKPFSVNQEGVTGFVDLEKIKSSLMGLNDILCSFNQPPDITLIEALMLFEYRRELTEGTMENLEEKLHMQIGSAVEAMNCIRDLNKKIPLTDLMKVVGNNINYLPTPIGGGEGALRHYRTFLKATISENFRNFVNDKKKRDLVKTLGATWGISFIEPLMGYRGQTFGLSEPFTYESSLSVLNVFINQVLQDKYYNPLNMVYINGDFYRRDNRAEFSETYDRLQSLPAKIRNYSLSFLVEGSFYTRFHDAIKNGGEKDGEERIKAVKILADKEGKDIIKNALEIVSSLSSLLKGIIMGTGGAYDTLSNYSELGGTRNREFKNDLISMEFLVSSFHKSFLDIVSLEEKSARGN